MNRWTVKLRKELDGLIRVGQVWLTFAFEAVDESRQAAGLWGGRQGWRVEGKRGGSNISVFVYLM